MQETDCSEQNNAFKGKANCFPFTVSKGLPGNDTAEEGGAVTEKIPKGS